MDITVTPLAGDTWALKDLLGRSLGYVVRTPEKTFIIRPEGHGIETMAAMKLGLFDSLDAALAEIERRTRAVCRMAASPE